MPTRLTRRAWFGPKTALGWGWTPTSWQGAVVSVVFVILIVASPVVWQGLPEVVAVTVLIGAFALIAVLTGGPPYDPDSR